MSKRAQAITNRKDALLPKGRTRKPLVDSDSPQAIAAEDERELRDARRALKEAQQKGSIPWEQVKREIGI
jgi:hypothetical protein